MRGAPGGNDYHQIWVDPKNANHLVLGVDQGATISLDRGKTWTTWYNQPTAQLYHVTTDHRFPYIIYGAQQDSGSIAVYSRSDHGHLDTRDWFLPGGSESGYIAIDPKDENIIYLSGTYGSVQRFDRRTSFSQNITPWPLGGFGLPINKRRYRDPWTPVLVFSPADKRSLYLGTQYVMKTVDGGLHWQQISPDLTGTVAGTDENGPTTNENAEQRGYGVVYTIAPSPLTADEIWAGTDTGRIHLTTDGGKHWRNVTPPGLSPWSKISLIEASHFDPATAYAAVDRHRLDDQKPYIYITHDFGKSWKFAVNGIASNHFLRAVREDTEQRNLLFAGTEFGIYISFDGGDNWQPLQLNLPVSSIRDMNVNGSDLIVATHGRSFWVLDDIAPLRRVAAAQKERAYLYAPPTAVRVDNDGFLGTPLPPEEPRRAIRRMALLSTTTFAATPPRSRFRYWMPRAMCYATFRTRTNRASSVHFYPSQSDGFPSRRFSRQVPENIVLCGIWQRAAPARAWTTMMKTQPPCRQVHALGPGFTHCASRWMVRRWTGGCMSSWTRALQVPLKSSSSSSRSPIPSTCRPDPAARRWLSSRAWKASSRSWLPTAKIVQLI